jgi:hypothetical protein
LTKIGIYFNVILKNEGGLVPVFNHVAPNPNVAISAAPFRFRDENPVRSFDFPVRRPEKLNLETGFVKLRLCSKTAFRTPLEVDAIHVVHLLQLV